ncbi:MAG: serine hydrolase domain-containing protein [Ignavibacteriaceae bacterium]
MQQPDVITALARADSMIESLQKKFSIPGVSFVVISNNKIIHSMNSGVADIRTKVPVNDSTMFEACSMSKPVFSYIALKQIESGKLKLDEPVWIVYDDSAFMGQESRKNITPRMLLSHTSGLPNWRPGDDEENGYLPVEFTPGLKFNYSGEGMYYLQKVVEKITGTTLDEYADRTLFEEVGARYSSFVYKEEFGDNIAAGHDESGNFLQKTNYRRANAGYSLYCSAHDFALFLIEITKKNRSGEYSLSKHTIDTMLSRQVRAHTREPIERPGDKRGIETFRGLGWSIDSTLSGDIYYHGGANSSGFRCYSQFNPREGSGIVIMTNSLSGADLWEEVIKKTSIP